MMNLRPLAALLLLCSVHAFVIPTNSRQSPPALLAKQKGENYGAMGSNKMNAARREKLGVADGEDEYDLYKALDTNTDPLITKIIAGSLIVALLALLVVGVVIPSTMDYGEGVCSPIQNGGRC